MTADEVLKQMQIAAAMQTDNPVCVINAQSKTIEVPEQYKLLGVENDKRVERIYFQCPKIVGDNQDLSQNYQLFINYQNANGDPDAYHIDDMEVDGDNITFSWLLEENVTKYKGNIKFAFGAIKPGDEILDPDKNRWNTTINTDCTCLVGLKSTQQVAESNPDALAQIWAAIDELKSGGGGGGTPGKDGVGIDRIEKTSTQGLVDTYTIYLTDESTYTFTVTNGKDGNPGAKGDPGENGITPTIGENGNWYLGETDTGKPSRGEKGDVGDGVPSGGTTGQVLTKNSNSDGDASWKNPNGVSDEQVKTAVRDYFEENPPSGVEIDDTLTQEGKAADAKTTGEELEKRIKKPEQEGENNQVLYNCGNGTTMWGESVKKASITKEKLAEGLIEELELKPNHNLTEVELETVRCNWDGTENPSGSYTLIKPFKTPNYIKINKTATPHKNLMTVYSSDISFSSDLKSNKPGDLFWRTLTADTLEPVFAVNMPGYEYCRILFNTTGLTAMAYYDDYEEPISEDNENAEVFFTIENNRIYAYAVTKYKDAKFYLMAKSQINGGQNMTDVFGTNDDRIISGNILKQDSGNTSLSDIDDYIPIMSYGTYTSNNGVKEFDAHEIINYRPKYLLFLLTRFNTVSGLSTREDYINYMRTNSVWVLQGGLSISLPVKETKFNYPVIKNPLNGSHWLLLGDSITEWFAGDDYSGEGFACKIALEFDMTFSNIAYEGENLDGGISRLNTYIEGVESGDNVTPDYVTIAYGTNGTASTIGTVNDDENTATYPGWVKKTINIIREKFPNASIGFILPMQGDWTGVNPGKDIKGNHDAIKAVLETDEYAVPYIDMWYESGITPDMLPSDEYPTDKIHLRSEKSQRLYYHAIRRFIMGL